MAAADDSSKLIAFHGAITDGDLVRISNLPAHSVDREQGILKRLANSSSRASGVALLPHSRGQGNGGDAFNSATRSLTAAATTTVRVRASTPSHRVLRMFQEVGQEVYVRSQRRAIVERKLGLLPGLAAGPDCASIIHRHALDLGFLHNERAAAAAHVKQRAHAISAEFTRDVRDRRLAASMALTRSLSLTEPLLGRLRGMWLEYRRHNDRSLFPLGLRSLSSLPPLPLEADELAHLFTQRACEALQGLRGGWHARVTEEVALCVLDMDEAQEQLLDASEGIFGAARRQLAARLAGSTAKGSTSRRHSSSSSAAASSLLVEPRTGAHGGAGGGSRMREQALDAAALAVDPHRGDLLRFVYRALSAELARRPDGEGDGVMPFPLDSSENGRTSAPSAVDLLPNSCTPEARQLLEDIRAQLASVREGMAAGGDAQSAVSAAGVVITKLLRRYDRDGHSLTGRMRGLFAAICVQMAAGLREHVYDSLSDLDGLLALYEVEQNRHDASNPAAEDNLEATTIEPGLPHPLPPAITLRLGVTFGFGRSLVSGSTGIRSPSASSARSGSQIITGPSIDAVKAGTAPAAVINATGLIDCEPDGPPPAKSPVSSRAEGIAAAPSSGAAAS